MPKLFVDLKGLAIVLMSFVQFIIDKTAITEVAVIFRLSLFCFAVGPDVLFMKDPSVSPPPACAP